jgi:hypothetical protein
MTTDATIQRLRRVNPVAPGHVENEVLLAKILATPADPRLAHRTLQATNVTFVLIRRKIRRRPMLALFAAGIVLLGSVGGGIAASRIFKSSAEEAQGLPGGSAMFIGTHPTCTPLTDQQFHCVLESAPTVEYVAGSYLGVKMPSVDASKHIDGGCISTSDTGLQWDCYLGQAAVKHGILDQSVLGLYQPQPSHG